MLRTLNLKAGSGKRIILNSKRHVNRCKDRTNNVHGWIEKCRYLSYFQIVFRQNYDIYYPHAFHNFTDLQRVVLMEEKKSRHCMSHFKRQN